MFELLNGLRSRLSRITPTGKLIALLLLIAVGTTHCAPFNWNDESRMATIQSLVESKTLVIDHSDFAITGDKVFVGGHFYSEKPPLPALIGAVVYAPLYALGFRLHFGNGVSYFVITLLTVSMAWLFGTMAVYSSLKFTGLSDGNRTLVALTLGVGSIFLTWATTFNNHEISAGCLSIGFMFLLRARFQEAPRNVALAGFFLSLAAAADIPTGIFFCVFAIYVIAIPQLRRYFAWFLLPLIITAVPTAVVDFAIHGNVMPVQIYQQYFNYPGSLWIGSNQLSGMKVNDFSFFCAYAVRSLFGPAGFVLYNPFAILGLLGCIQVIKRREKFWPEAVCVLASCLVLCTYYWATTNNYGGRAYSIRWFVPLLPPLSFFLYPYAQQPTRRRRQCFMFVLAISTVIALVGALNPWSLLASSDVPFVDNIHEYFTRLPPGFTF